MKIRQTIDSVYRNEKTDFSEFPQTSNKEKTHRKFESHHDINSLLKKNTEYYTNPNPNQKAKVKF